MTHQMLEQYCQKFSHIKENLSDLLNHKNRGDVFKHMIRKSICFICTDKIDAIVIPKF